MARSDQRNVRGGPLLSARRAAFKPVLRALGVELEFLALPQAVRDFVYRYRLAPPAVEPAPAFAADPNARPLCDLIARSWRVPFAAPADGWPKLSAHDLTAIAASVHVGLKVCFTFPRTTVLSLDPAAVTGRLADFLAIPDEQIHFAAIHAQEVMALISVMRSSAPDDRVFYAKFDRDRADERGKRRVVAVVNCAPVPRVSLGGPVAAGEARTAYRLTLGGLAGEPVPVDWPADALGAGPAGTTLPVYLQAHVTRRVVERLEAGLSPWDARAAMLFSLTSPAFARREGRRVWVEYRDPSNQRLGYFVAEVVDAAPVVRPAKHAPGRPATPRPATQRIVLVRTFLFLTMRGTPEGERLARRLGARAADLEMARLDRLATFVNTDVADDPELAALLTECGCGQLLAMRPAEATTESGFAGWAGEVRHYFGMGAPATRPAIADAA